MTKNDNTKTVRITPRLRRRPTETQPVCFPLFAGLVFEPAGVDEVAVYRANGFTAMICRDVATRSNYGMTVGKAGDYAEIEFPATAAGCVADQRQHVELVLKELV